MRRGFLICWGLLCFINWVNARPVVALSAGVDTAHVAQNTQIMMLFPFSNIYAGTKKTSTEGMVGVFLGGESPVFDLDLDWQYGIRYFQSHTHTVAGTVYQFSDPLFNNLNYQYNIINRRLLFEAKMIGIMFPYMHPYVLGNIGSGFNRTYQYMEFPRTSADAPMVIPFQDKSTNGFSYAIGGGLEIPLWSPNVRLGFNYRYAYLGPAGLGKTPLQEGLNTIYHPHLFANEYLLELSYVV